MPHPNQFRHQTYCDSLPETSYHVLSGLKPISPDAVDFHARVAAACAPFRTVRLAAVFLVHGTFVGNDALGLLTELRRYWPELSERLRSAIKGMVDLVVGETGNYTAEFADALGAGLTAAQGGVVPVRRFNWSSQNNHIGRADGAIGLIAELATLAESIPADRFTSDRPPRAMLWGHSHGGNVLAIVTNLLAADAETRQQFFDAARIFFQRSRESAPDFPAWQQVEQLLADPEHPVRKLALEIVTFGTPIRYGWDTAGYDKLLHFVNHRPTASLPEYRTGHPLRPRQFWRAVDGDTIHQIGISGSNFIPNPLALRTLRADWRLKRLFEHNLAWECLLTKLSRGQRVPEEGLTLLVDYQDSSWNPTYHLSGHAAYTRREWLPFQLTEIAKVFC